MPRGATPSWMKMWEALRAATDHAPIEVAAEDSASHVQPIFRRKCNLFPFHKAGHG